MILTPPVVSILMPVKNAELWLQECLESILTQTFEDWELIVVNDHSSDKSVEILKDFTKKDERIKLIENQGNGIIDALRTAFSNSASEFITRMDADDVMPIDKLETLVQLVQKSPNSIATGKVQYFSDGKISEGYLDYENWLNERVESNDHWQWIYRECVIASANWMCHRSKFYLEPEHYPEDYNLVFHWYKSRVPIVSSKNVTHLWREHPKRTSRNSKNYDQQAFFDLKLQRFLELDRDSSRPLAVMGKNQKAKLTSTFLKSHNIDHHIVDLENLHRFGELNDPQVLVAVYPAKIVRDGIVDLLHGFGLEMGSDWWWI